MKKIVALGAIALMSISSLALAAGSPSFPELSCSEYVGSWYFKNTPPTSAAGTNLQIKVDGSNMYYKNDYADGVAGKWSGWHAVTVTRGASTYSVKTQRATWTLIPSGQQISGSSAREDGSQTVLSFRCSKV